MLFRFSGLHRVFGWILTVLGIVALVAGGRGYLMQAPVRLSWVLGGLIAIVSGTALVRWARRARPE